MLYNTHAQTTPIRMSEGISRAAHTIATAIEHMLIEDEK